jgi:hypothetical protein
LHRRAWTSLYAAPRNGRIDEEAARDLLANQPPLQADDGKRIAVYAVDRSVWFRCDAEASPERGYYHHPSRHSAGQPIVAGLGFERDSWVAPVDARRVRPYEDANDTAAEQVEALIRRLPEQPAPLFVFDAGYDPVRLRGEKAALPRSWCACTSLPRGERRRKSKKLWLWWHGEVAPDLELLCHLSGNI